MRRKKPSESNEGAILAVVDPSTTNEVPPAEQPLPPSSVSDVPDFDVFDVSDASSVGEPSMTPVEYVEQMLNTHESLVMMKLNPLSRAAQPIQKYYLGRNGVVYRTDNDRRVKTNRSENLTTNIRMDYVRVLLFTKLGMRQIKEQIRKVII